MSQKVTRQLGNMMIELQMGNAILKKEKKTYGANTSTSNDFLFRVMAAVLPGDSFLINFKDRSKVTYYVNRKLFNNKYFYMINAVDGSKRFTPDSDVRVYCINKAIPPRLEFAKAPFEEYITRENFDVEEKTKEQFDVMQERKDTKYYKIEHDVPLRSYRNMVKGFLKTLIPGQFFEIGFNDNALYKEICKELLKEKVLVTVKYKSSDKSVPMKNKKFIVHKYEWDEEEGKRILGNLANRKEINAKLHAEGKMGGKKKSDLENKV